MQKLKNKKTQNQIIVTLTHIGSLIPLALLVFDFYTNNLTANPIQAATLRTGKAALVLLVLSLAGSPLASIFRITVAAKLRKPLGLYAFMYSLIHFLIFIWVDLGLNWEFIKDGFLQKPYALIGFAAFFILLLMAATSTRGWQKRLGKTWKQLHRLVYVAGLLVIVHYVWLVKSDIREPLVWGLAISILLLVRVKTIKQWLLDRKNRSKTTGAKTGNPATKTQNSTAP
jgi:sulfoxide reductase heme-binding subunit YedZ